MEPIIIAVLIILVLLGLWYLYTNYYSESYHAWGRCLRCGRHKRWHGSGAVCMCGCEGYESGASYQDPYAKTGFSNTLARRFGNQNAAQSTQFTTNPCVGTWDCWLNNSKQLIPGINYNHTADMSHMVHY